MNNLCAFCDQPAKYLCDHEHTWSKYGYEKGRLVREMDGEPVTCDCPMCGDCRVISGRVFDLDGKGSFDTRDTCQAHPNDLGRMQKLTPGEVEHRRLRDWKFRYMQRE